MRASDKAPERDAERVITPVCYERPTRSSDLCDQQHNRQADGEARLSSTFDGARIGLH